MSFLPEKVSTSKFSLYLTWPCSHQGELEQDGELVLWQGKKRRSPLAVFSRCGRAAFPSVHQATSTLALLLSVKLTCQAESMILFKCNGSCISRTRVKVVRGQHSGELKLFLLLCLVITVLRFRDYRKLPRSSTSGVFFIKNVTYTG